MIKKHFNNAKINIQKSTLIYLLVFSFIAAKSIFINPFTKHSGILGILIGLLIVLALFLLSVLAVFYLSKIKWNQKITHVNKSRILLYMLPGLSFSTLIWLCNFPAIVPYDTAYMWHTISTNLYTDFHPITYVVFMEFLMSLWNSFSMMVLFQIIFCSFVYGYTSYVFEKQGMPKKFAWLISIILALIPVNAITTVTVLKDVTYIMSLVFMSAVFFDFISTKDYKISHLILLIIAGVIAMCSRHNGIIVIPLCFILAIFLFILKKNKRQIVLLSLSLAVLLFSYFGIKNIVLNSLRNSYTKGLGIYASISIPASQMSNVIATHWYEFNDETKEKATLFFNTDYIGDRKNTYENWQFNYALLANINLSTISNDKAGFLKFYIDAVKNYFPITLESYEKITAIAWAVPNYGYTTTRNYGIADPFNEIPNDSQPVLPKLRKFLDSTLFSVGDGFYFLWRPALPLLLSFLLLIIALNKHGKFSVLVISPAIFNALGYMIANPSQNARYLYCNISIFIIFLLYTLMSPKKKISEDHNIKNILYKKSPQLKSWGKMDME